MTSEHAGLYLNSSFGVIPTISGNIPTPIFPLTALGLSLNWQIAEQSSWLAAIYDGHPTDFEDNNPYNLRWKLNREDGILAISEFQQSTGSGKLPGTYKLGLFVHPNHLIVGEVAEEPDTLYENNYGIYIIADQMLWRMSGSNKGLGIFFQLGLTPEKFNFNHYYTGAGLNFYGLLEMHEADVLGLAIAHAGIAEEARSETTLELTYQLPLTKNIFIQPDFQYLINPSGTGEELENSFTATLRFGISF